MESSRFFEKNGLHGKPFFTMGLTVFCVFFLCATTAQAWWQEDWTMRRQIDLNTTAQGANIQEAVANIPILLRLHTGNFDFKKAKPDGSDIRFVAADDVTSLKYEIDTFDVINEIALIWVKVPEIKANAADNRLFMYYGNEKAKDSQDKIGVFAHGQALVYHLGESEGNPQDSTQYKNHAVRFSGGQSLPTVVGNGISLFGGQDSIVVPSSPTINLVDGFSLSAWIKLAQPSTDGYLFSQTEQNNGIIVGVDGEKAYARILNNGAVVQTEGDAVLTLGNWHHLAVTAKAGGKLSLYIDGREAASTALAQQLPALKTELFFGSSQTDGHQLTAELDEIELSTTTRSPAWITTVFASQGIESKLVSCGAEMSDGGEDTFSEMHLDTIVGNITLDGWVIISLLVVMGSGAMLVLVSKSYFLYLSHKDNKAFKESFDQMETLFKHGNVFDDFDNSSLCRIYFNGCETITGMLRKKSNQIRPVLSGKEMDFFKASLERGYLQETKKFQSWMMVLPLAISGGPFLGLLGTVWGVMNTFAAMAAAGDANIMAIAPGVASALAATVCGLLVAIPALFGYNYLSGQIKNQTADIGIFVDEFIMLVDRDHGEEQ